MHKQLCSVMPSGIGHDSRFMQLSSSLSPLHTPLYLLD